MDSLVMPDRSTWSAENFEFVQSAYTHQAPTPMIEELSLMPAEPSLDQSPMQHLYPQDHSKALQSYMWTGLGLQCFNPDATLRPQIRDDRAESSDVGYLGPGHTTCQILSAPFPSIHEVPQSKANKEYCIKDKKPRARSGVFKQKQE
ncbi:hypothetical protein N7467_010779 [Penicillium canescens]|nr:hypothetical protein N7467_010779 [Penicillium canescens]